MAVSVIIPVYNASKTIRRAVLSVLEQPEVAAILLVEDGSIDESLRICHELEEQYSQVHLYCHPNNTNLGAGASRNLGISKLNTPYVAFLDADDYLLPNRFSQSIHILESTPNIGGVYGTADYHFDSSEAQELYQSIYGTHILMQIDHVVPPEKLFEHLMGAGFQYFSIITLVLRTQLLRNNIKFDESLRQHQDTDFIWQLARNTQIVTDKLFSPIATINIHGNNRVLDQTVARKFRHQLMKKWMKIANREVLPPKSSLYILRNYLDNHPFVQSKIKPMKKIKKILLLVPSALKHPALFLRILTRS